MCAASKQGPTCIVIVTSLYIRLYIWRRSATSIPCFRRAINFTATSILGKNVLMYTCVQANCVRTVEENVADVGGLRIAYQVSNKSSANSWSFPFTFWSKASVDGAFSFRWGRYDSGRCRRWLKYIKLYIRGRVIGLVLFAICALFCRLLNTIRKTLKPPLNCQSAISPTISFSSSPLLRWEAKR